MDKSFGDLYTPIQQFGGLRFSILLQTVIKKVERRPNDFLSVQELSEEKLSKR